MPGMRQLGVVLLLPGLLLVACGRYGFGQDPASDGGVPDDLGVPADTGVPEDANTDSDIGEPDTGTTRRQPGCEDGTREGFIDDLAYPDIAGCAGAFDQPGVLATTAPACGGSGDDHPTNAAGVGCNVADLCAIGWHVCSSAGDIVGSGAATCDDAAPTPGLFFITRVTGGGLGTCFEGPTNDVFGCGSLGDPDVAVECHPINRFLEDGCSADPASTWVCPFGAEEANLVVHVDPSTGGALCCRD